MELRQRIEELRTTIRLEAFTLLQQQHTNEFHDLCEMLVEINPITVGYNYWVLWEMHDEGLITIHEDLTIELHTIY